MTKNRPKSAKITHPKMEPKRRVGGTPQDIVTCFAFFQNLSFDTRMFLVLHYGEANRDLVVRAIDRYLGREVK